MDDELSKEAMHISGRLDQLREEHQRIAVAAFAVLERLDVEIALLAVEALADREHAATWFTEDVCSLGWQTPWRCMAEGGRDDVERVLGAIIYGIPM